MISNFTIDGINGSTFNMFVSEDGNKDLLMYAPTKEVNISNYKEVDGITADLTEVYLKNKTVNINFGILGSIEQYRAFIDKIRDKAYHTFEFSQIGLTEKLRYISESKLNNNDKFTLVTVQFADDFPRKYQEDLLSYLPPQPPIPQPPIVPVSNLEIDGINLQRYGLRVLGGTLDSILKNPKAKQGTTTSNRTMDSVFYADTDTKFEGKEITINLLMKARDLSEFWQNYTEFQRILCSNGVKKLYDADMPATFWFYYKSCAVKDFSPTGKIWFTFSITISILSYILGDDILLATEDNQFILTENNKYIKVNVA
jgi:hypothetical protein